MAIRDNLKGGGKVLTGIANITDTTTKTVSVNLGGKPKMLIAKIFHTSNGGLYTLRSWNGTEMISSAPDLTKNQLYETSLCFGSCHVPETGDMVTEKLLK